MIRTVLYHFCCEHSFKEIGRYGTLKPGLYPLLGKPLLWLTDDPGQSREALGLTSCTIPCDRMEFLYRTEDTTKCVPFKEWAEKNLIGGMQNFLVAQLLDETNNPEHWWVSEESLIGSLVKVELRRGT